MSGYDYVEVKAKRTRWTNRFLLTGLGGFGGAASSAVSNMDSLDFFSLNFGTWIVILFWILFASIGGVIWLYYYQKLKGIEKRNKQTD